MKRSLSLPVVAIVTTILASVSPLNLALAEPVGTKTATAFAQKEIDQTKLIAIAAPRGSSAHQLLILEQVSSARSCWSEKGSSPTLIDPLLLNFNFTGVCGRSTDSNGYSIRMGNQDLGLEYSLRLVKRNNDILLIGVPAKDRKAPEIQIGRTRGVTSSFAKIILEPGWRFTKRAYNGKTLGHFYFTNDLSLSSWIATAPVSQPVTPLPKPPAAQPPVAIPIPPPASSVKPLPQPPAAQTPVAIPVPPPATGVIPKPPVSSVPVNRPPAPTPSTSNGSSGTFVVPTVDVGSPARPTPQPANSGTFVVPTVEVAP